MRRRSPSVSFGHPGASALSGPFERLDTPELHGERPGRRRELPVRGARGERQRHRRPIGCAGPGESGFHADIEHGGGDDGDVDHRRSCGRAALQTPLARGRNPFPASRRRDGGGISTRRLDGTAGRADRQLARPVRSAGMHLPDAVMRLARVSMSKPSISMDMSVLEPALSLCGARSSATGLPGGSGHAAFCFRAGATNWGRHVRQPRPRPTISCPGAAWRRGRGRRPRFRCVRLPG